MKKILWLLHYKGIFDSFYQMKLSKRLYYYDQPWFEDLLKLERADLMGCMPEDKSEHAQAVLELDRIYENWEYSHRAGILPSHQKEFFDGEDIMRLTGLSAGARIGELKLALRELQMEGEIKTKAEAEAWLRGQG